LSGCSNWTDKNYSCLTRDNHGCPDEECTIYTGDKNEC
ncbi:unnamed protein product, partial [marine sediment metagenome]